MDEFQNFATESFAGVLSEARKYRLNLTIVHQYIGQLVSDVSTKVRDAVFGNVGTMIVFRVGAADAEFLENEFEPEFVIQDIVNLPNFRIYLKLMVDGVTSRPFSAKTLPQFNLRDEVMTEQEVIDISRKNYARDREEVEQEVRAWSSNQPIGDVPERGDGKGVGAPRGDRQQRDNFTAGGKQLFDVQCSICGKDAKVPFEPRPGRPVYCPECYGKIEKGELKPVFSARVSQNKVASSTSALAALGIEFGVNEAGGAPAAGLPRGGGQGGGQGAGRPPRFEQRPDQRSERPQYDRRPPHDKPRERRDHPPRVSAPCRYKQGLKGALEDLLKDK